MYYGRHFNVAAEHILWAWLDRITQQHRSHRQQQLSKRMAWPYKQSKEINKEQQNYETRVHLKVHVQSHIKGWCDTPSQATMHLP
jgi:hypothetical protein